jgi:hypothetical protein
MVSRAFIHAYCTSIMEKIIEHEGHNHWLVDGTPHCNVRGILLTPSTELPPDQVVLLIAFTCMYRSDQANRSFPLVLCYI